MAQNFVDGDKELIEKFHKMSAAVQGASLGSVAMAGGRVVVNAAKKNIKEEGLIRTRHLSRSIDQELTEQSSERAAVDIGTNLEYATIHEFGGVITPKKGKYLAIPVGTYTGSPSRYPDLVTIKSGGGDPVMIDAEGRVQFVLKTSVEIPARPYLRPALDENKEKVLKEMGLAFADVIMKAAS